jgi:hypothetical protein
MPPEERQAIEGWIAKQVDPLTLSAAIRGLVKRGLEGGRATHKSPQVEHIITLIDQLGDEQRTRLLAAIMPKRRKS